MASCMTSRICEPGVAGLLEGRAEHVGGQPVDLGVELQGGDEVGGAGHLEVHVAEGVLGAEDVGEGDVLALRVDQAHGDAGDRGLDRHAGVHQRQASTRTPTPSTSSRWRPAPRTPDAGCRGTPRRWARPAAGPARRAGRGRSRAASGCRPGRSRRWRTAACCSGACSASCSSMPMVSSSWSIRGMPRVVTLSTWVSPRWNRPDPWAVATMPDLGRQRPDVAPGPGRRCGRPPRRCACGPASWSASGPRP